LRRINMNMQKEQEAGGSGCGPVCCSPGSGSGSGCSPKKVIYYGVLVIALCAALVALLA
jgi:hypothetical protein